MKILLRDEILEIENKTLESQGISRLNLVERVAAALAEEITNLCPRRNSNIWVIAGWGNNGADALETARLLALNGYRLSVYLFNIGGNRLSAECAQIRDRIIDQPGINLVEINGVEPYRWPDPDSNTTIIDGLFGSGLNRPLPRVFQLLAQNINNSGATVVSIDIPSGLMSEWNGNSPRENMLHATVTLAVEFPKLAFMLGDNAEVVGNWKVLDIGLDKKAIKQAPYSFMLVDKKLASLFLSPRKPFSSKADYGNAFIIAGSRGMMGAAILSAQGALRAGAGKVTVYSVASGNDIVQTAVPCAMYRQDNHNEHIVTIPFDTKYNAYAIGPGIGTHDETVIAFEKFVKAAAAASRRIVIDADGLNIIAKRPIILNYLPPLSVITPHVGEFDRIFGESSTEEERLKKAIKCAEEYSLIIVLKGHHTAVVRPDGKITFNSSGTPAMATPGSGDVLTGIITGLMAIGLDSEIAALVAPYIHGLAGEMAEEEHGEYGVTASDIAQNVGKAIKEIMNFM